MSDRDLRAPVRCDRCAREAGAHVAPGAADRRASTGGASTSSSVFSAPRRGRDGRRRGRPSTARCSFYPRRLGEEQVPVRLRRAPLVRRRDPGVGAGVTGVGGQGRAPAGGRSRARRTSTAEGSDPPPQRRVRAAGRVVLPARRARSSSTSEESSMTSRSRAAMARSIGSSSRIGSAARPCM